MANPFLSRIPRDTETALLWEDAIECDFGNRVAATDGDKVFINTKENLERLLPEYNDDFCKWLLWHERYHKELLHHERFFKFLEDEEGKGDFVLTHDEVNIIMDILVHDSLCKMFPELVELAKKNGAQIRNSNVLRYTFKTFTLEEMIREYNQFKLDNAEEGEGEPSDDHEGEERKGKDKDTKEGKGKKEGKKEEGEDTKEGENKEGEPGMDSEQKTTPEDTDDSKEGKKKGHAKGGTSEKPKDTAEEETEAASPTEQEDADDHEGRDWDAVKDVDNTEFLDEYDSMRIQNAVQDLRRRKINLAKLTKKLNSMVTSTRERTYATPSRIQVTPGVMLKGRKPAKVALYLCFDASGSMGSELKLFKQVIKESIPQALNTPCEWFTDEYFKGKFKDMLEVYASSGFNDDGDRLLELCWKAEQKGYNPIGVTDGGGGIYWNEKHLKELKRTILVGSSKYWLNECKRINPSIQIIYLERE